MIPTRFRHKLPKDLSYPLGAADVNRALSQIPVDGPIELTFRDRPVYRASEFRRMLRESLPCQILVASWRPAMRGGHISSRSWVEGGYNEAKWVLEVNSVLLRNRQLARRLLLEQGLPAVARWMLRVRSDVERYQRVELVFAPLDETLSIRDHAGP